MASKLFSFLSGDPLERAQQALREGKKDKAAELFVKAKDFTQAIRLYAELGNLEKAVETALIATLGHVPEGYAGAEPVQVGELLAVRGFYKEAIDLFELAGAYRQAAESALKLQQFPLAARLFEKGKSWGEAAVYFQRAKLYNDALRNLDQESKRLRQDPRTRADAGAQSKLREIDLKRAEILMNLGRGAEGAVLLRDVQATPKAAQMLEEAGKPLEAFQAYLQMRELPKAAQIVARTPSLDRKQIAQLYLGAGHPLEAAALYVALGQPREAAEAYSAGKDWAKAGAYWEAARDPQRAAECYLRADKARDAARCFTLAGKPQLAAGAYVKLGDHASAATSYLRAGLLLDAGSSYLAAGDRAEAAKVLTQIQPGDRSFDEAALLLGPVLIEEGLFDDALQRLRRVAVDERPNAAASPKLLERLYWEARALEGLGRMPDAVGLFEKLVSLKADHRDAAKRLRNAQVNLQASQLRMTTVAPPGAGPGSATQVTQPTLLTSPPGGAAPVLSSEPGPGQRLAGRYDILSELGKGGMGRVYKALDRELGEVVAIKTLLRQDDVSAGDEERLLREVQICRRITHPNVVRVFDMGRFEGGIFITMEFLEGQRLDELVTGRNNLPLKTIKRVLSEVAAGLQEAHGLGVVHRDLKPSNIILTPTRLKILDFGIARMAGFESQLTQTGFAVGSPHYMSPEQLQGISIDGRSDLYSLGVMTYLLLTGREPFHASTMAALALQHLQEAPPPVQNGRPGLPEPWSDFVHRLLAKQPNQRYSSAREVLHAVQQLPD